MISLTDELEIRAYRCFMLQACDRHWHVFLSLSDRAEHCGQIKIKPLQLRCTTTNPLACCLQPIFQSKWLDVFFQNKPQGQIHKHTCYYECQLNKQAGRCTPGCRHDVSWGESSVSLTACPPTTAHTHITEAWVPPANKWLVRTAWHTFQLQKDRRGPELVVH